jgi:hypothetical protein
MKWRRKPGALVLSVALCIILILTTVAMSKYATGEEGQDKIVICIPTPLPLIERNDYD